jgi:hypothetical protein
MGQQNPKAAGVPKIGGFTLLRTLLHAEGTSASNAVNLNKTITNAASSRTNVRPRAALRSHISPRLFHSITLITIVGLLFSAATANANFTRKFERAIYRSESSGGRLFTEPCTEAEAGTPGSSCLHPGGVAVNPEGVSPENGLWLGGLELIHSEGEGLDAEHKVLKENELFEFEPASAPGDNAPDSAGSFKAPCLEDPGKGEWEESKCLTKATVPGGGDFEKSSAPESVAVESGGLSGNGDLYTAGGHTVEVYESGGVHKHLETWTGFNEPHIAIDNAPELSADPSHCVLGECFVYVSDSLSNSGPSGDLSALQKFNSHGVAEPFTDSGDPGTPYVKGNEITGRPEGCGEVFKQRQELGGVTVDPEGDIYIANLGCHRVFEYEPSGKFKQEFNLEGGAHEPAESPHGVAYDSVSHNLLITANRSAEGKLFGVIDEFEAATGRFVAQITSTPEGGLENPQAVTVDSRGDVYVAEDEIPAGQGGKPAEGRNAVYVFGPGGYYPTVTLGQASERAPTSAVLNGSVNPAQKGNPTPAPVTECDFQYIGEEAYEKNLAAKQEDGFKGARVAQCVPGTIPAEPEASTAVHANIGEPPEPLTPGETYRYRLIATTEKAANGGTVETESFAFTAPANPGIVSTTAGNLSSTSADLHAQINPLGAATSYHFEYDTRPYAEGESAHGLSVPVPDAGIGAGGPAGSSFERVLQPIGSLAPGTTYYFRVVAENAQGTASGGVCAGEAGLRPDCAFTTQPASVSSERGYELVTPATKQGGSDMFAEKDETVIQNFRDVGTPTESGDGFVFRTQSSFGEFPFAGATSSYVFRRESAQGHWGYTSLAAPSLGVQQMRDEAPLFEPFESTKVAFDDQVGSLAGEEGVQVVSLIGPPGGGAGGYTKLHEDVPIHGASEGLSTELVGGSRDMGHVVLATASHSACPGAEEVEHGDLLCEWSGAELQLVNVSPQDESEPASECGARLGSSNSKSPQGGLARNAVSASGASVFFTAPGPETTGVGKCWNGGQKEKVEGPKNAPQLYARIGHQEAGGEVTHQVVELSTPEATVKEPGSPGERPLQYPAIFTGASEGGSKVFFETRTWMTENHPSVHDAELYEWEAAGTGVCSESVAGYTAASIGCLTRVSAGEEGSEAEQEGARTLFVPAVSADGSTVYFTAFSVLAPGATRYATTEQSGTHGPVNLYRYDTLSHSTSFVAPVDTADFSNEPQCETFISAEQGFSSAWTAPCSDANWYTTPDGRYLLFGDSLQVGSNNVAEDGCAELSLPSTQHALDGRCSELYRYSAEAAERGEQATVCVSCGSEGPQGADEAGNAQFDRSASNGPSSSVVQGMSDNGEYVFFDSQADLVTGASSPTLHVYQWREDQATHERALSLIGSGTDPAPTYFLGSSPYEYETAAGRNVCRRNPEREAEPGHNCEVVEGGNVFIGTHARLSTQQTNSVGNLYDARICEPQSPCIQPPAGETAQCEGGSCQTPPPLPLFQSPATNTLTSSGNITPPTSSSNKPKPLTTAQKLANALKVCKKAKSKAKRKTCEAAARKKYKTTKAKKSSKSKRGGKS